MTKKPVRKAAKKAAQKQKLIEGQYSHKFLTRLRPEHGELLAELMKATENKTFNGAIVFLITNYSRIKSERDRLKNDFQTMQSQMYKSSDLLSSLRENLKELLEPKITLEALRIDSTQCKTCGETFDKWGDCPEGCEQD